MRIPTLAFTVLALLCFALPFFVVSCQGHPVDTVTGVNLVTGRDVPAALNSAQGQHLPSNVWAIGAVILGFAGMLLVALRRDNSREGLLAAAALCAAAICMLLILLAARDAISHQLLLSVRVAYGYYLSLIFMLAGAVTSVLGARSRAPTSSSG